jgi:serine O-acetyltransferase
VPVVDTDQAARRALMRSIRRRQPPFTAAVLGDARVAAGYRGERSEFRSAPDALLQVLRLCWASDAFAAQVLYRAKAAMQAKGIPVLPQVAHRLGMAIAQLSIGDPVVIEPGLYVIHGQVVIDGLVTIGAGTVVAPWVTIGLRAGDVQGATIGRGVQIGTGAKVIGPVQVGDLAQIGANAVVVTDVASKTTVVGAPARVVRE